MPRLPRLDDAVRTFVVNHQSSALRNLMRNVSCFGDWPEHFALGLVLATAAWWRGNKKWTRIFLSMLLALAIAGLVARAIKISTGRARPSVKSEQVWNGPRFSSKYHAFPSGHVVASTAFFAVLAFANWRVGIPCLAIPLLIGFSESTGEHTICPMLLARRFWESHLQFWCGALSSPRSTIDNLKVPVRRRTGEGEIIDLAIA